eukprot:TRINITY_DN5302_c0_g1_i7.p1 TRINITY_DN5302_c0_g1~~TRINITY_DN5302_c0_g1_i7.p1  ORF type:complete len:216 (-),score=29.84 TRINITY_DN5302_c0_g1_i7:197-844(-)
MQHMPICISNFVSAFVPPRTPISRNFNTPIQICSRKRIVPSKLKRTAIGVLATAEAVQASQHQTGDVWLQKEVNLKPYSRGCHVITREIYKQMQELSEMEVGIANIFILHTSASLTINENASPDVPMDLNDSLDRIVPEGRMYRHLDEGYDDMPAHVKSSLMGASLTIPIRHGKFALGTWQGVYLNEQWPDFGCEGIKVQRAHQPTSQCQGKKKI